MPINSMWWCRSNIDSQEGENGEYVIVYVLNIAHPVKVYAVHLTPAFNLFLVMYSFENFPEAVATGGY